MCTTSVSALYKPAIVSYRLFMVWEYTMVPTQLYTLALVILLVQLASQLVVDQQCYVKPADSNASCPYPCYTLQEYADNEVVVKNCSFGNANTAYIFQNGMHELFH